MTDRRRWTLRLLSGAAALAVAAVAGISAAPPAEAAVTRTCTVIGNGNVMARFQITQWGGGDSISVRPTFYTSDNYVSRAAVVWNTTYFDDLQSYPWRGGNWETQSLRDGGWEQAFVIVNFTHRSTGEVVRKGCTVDF